MYPPFSYVCGKMFSSSQKNGMFEIRFRENYAVLVDAVWQVQSFFPFSSDSNPKATPTFCGQDYFNIAGERDRQAREMRKNANSMQLRKKETLERNKAAEIRKYVHPLIHSRCMLQT